MNSSWSFMAREAKALLKDREAAEAASSFPSSRHGNLSAASSDDRLKDILQSVRSSKSPAVVYYGASWNPALVKRIGAATALEVRATGIPYVFAPCVAVCRDPRWGRCYESYSEDPKVVQAMTEIIPGLQGDVPPNSRGTPFVRGCQCKSLGRRRQRLTKVMHSAPIYIAETSPRQIRGILVSMKEFFIILGLLLGYTLSSIYVDSVAGWRYMYASSAPVCLIMGIGMWWLPPSPRWLLLSATQGKQDITTIKQLAVSCFCRLRGQATDSSSLQEVDSILDELHADLEKQVTIGEIFQGKCLKALIIGGGLVFFQQVTGQPSVLYYAATILQSAGFDAASDATRVSILIGLLKLIMTGIAVFVVDKFGRRPMLIGGVSGMAISLFLLSTYYTLSKDLPFIAVIALLSYVGCYQVSFGPIGWLMISEVFPLRFRGRGLSIAVLVNFTSNALVTFSFSLLQDWVGTASIFAGFGVVATAALVFIYFIVPETKGLTLEEIEAKIL